MQTRAFALSLLALTGGAACAQTPAAPSSVTLYGIVDAGIQHTTGYQGGSINGLVSGIMDGTRLGLQGQ